MTEFKGTPGPWLIADKSFVYALNARAENRVSIQIMPGRISLTEWIPDEELAANARLIAAAPDLLDMAESVAANGLHADTLKACGCATCTQALNARALVARIKGES